MKSIIDYTPRKDGEMKSNEIPSFGRSKVFKKKNRIEAIEFSTVGTRIRTPKYEEIISRDECEIFFKAEWKGKSFEITVKLTKRKIEKFFTGIEKEMGKIISDDVIYGLDAPIRHLTVYFDDGSYTEIHTMGFLPECIENGLEVLNGDAGDLFRQSHKALGYRPWWCSGSTDSA